MELTMKALFNYTVESRDDTGLLLYSEKGHNLTVSGGLGFVRDSLITGTTKLVGLIAFGSGTTAAYSTDTALQTPLAVVAVSTANTYAPGGVQFQCILGATLCAGSTVKEIGLMTASSFLLARALLGTPLAKTTAAPTVDTFTWNVEFSL
jgi:hypothetical protein